MSESNVVETKLMYQPFTSVLNPGFWQQLTNLKLNKLKLSKDPVDVFGSYACDLSETLPCLASFDHTSFNEQSRNTKSCPLNGTLVCTNIIQEFLEYDKKDYLNCIGRKIWESICSGQALSDPERYLSKFGLLVHADLKKYKFFYWFSFPAINYPREVQLTQDNYTESDKESFCRISSVFDERLLIKFHEEYEKTDKERSFQRGYFLVKHFKQRSSGKEGLSLHPLTDYNIASQAQEDQIICQVYFAFSDPSAHTCYPGWPLRNYLALIAVQFQLEEVYLIRVRFGNPRAGTQHDNRLRISNSLIFKINLNLAEESHKGLPESSAVPTITGWEKNESQQIAPKRVDLSCLLDPRKLAEDAVNLNLRLMKWRLLPNLDLDKIAETRCLILGCGTLGCHIARGLLAWGVKNMTIVDNAKISYSNPVRQTLYTFDDCSKSSNNFKALAAAASLERIHPSVNVKPVVLSIPMPGHHIADSEIEQTKHDISVLENLIENHDAVFLLMDTRESRWLPSVIALSRQKLVINAAIGFDTFLLQRYGIRNYEEVEPSIKESSSNSSAGDEIPATSTNSDIPVKNFLSSDQLGCYFCNDIVAPGDSTLDRTLDQQCTVSRPGVSMMVSAMAVELLASIISSERGPHTPAPIDVPANLSATDDDFGSELGIVPHSIRGNLARYFIYMPTSPLFNKCSACSPAVIKAYKTQGYEFLQQVFEDPNHLEEVAGLKDLQNISDNVWALDSDEDQP